LVDPLHHFPPSDRERLHRAIESARKSTSAKFEFIAVPASERYALFPVAWGAVAALVATGILAALRPWLGIGTGFVVDAVLFVIFCVVLDWWPLRLFLVPRAARRAAASRMAHREFAAHVMSQDPAHSGVLLFVSLAERHLEIVAGRAAHAAVPAGTWDKIVSDATASMGRGTVDGLVSAIAACGATLATAFPPVSRP